MIQSKAVGGEHHVTRWLSFSLVISECTKYLKPEGSRETEERGCGEHGRNYSSLSVLFVYGMHIMCERLFHDKSM